MLFDALRSRTGGLGERLAVSAPDRDLTFGELWAEADRLASVLGAAGVASGTVVALALPNDSRFASTFLALCRLDATVALVSPQYGPAELRPIMEGTGLGSLVTEPKLRTRIAAAAPGSHFFEVEGLAILFPQPSGPGSAIGGAAVYKFSSGSTAEPKGIALTEPNLVAEAENLAATFALGPDDRILAAVPVVHSYGFDLGVLQALFVGATLVLEDAFVPRRSLAALAKGDITMFLGVPAQYRLFLSSRLTVVPSLAATPWLLSCTAPLGQDVVGSFHERFKAVICQHYGSSETGAATNHLPAEVLRRPASVGRPISGVTVTVRAPDGSQLPPRAEGEVFVSSAAVADGYTLGEPSGLSPFRDGGFWTGDLGQMDDDGFLTVIGRRAVTINVGGLKVSPAEVAAVLERHPAVREAAVVGVADGHGEQVVYAVVTVRAATDEGSLLEFCRGALAEHKVPRRIEIRGELPRTASGKVRLRPQDIV